MRENTKNKEEKTMCLKFLHDSKAAFMISCLYFNIQPVLLCIDYFLDSVPSPSTTNARQFYFGMTIGQSNPAFGLGNG